MYEGLTEIESLMAMLLKLLNPLSSAAGIGNKLVAVFSTQEAANCFGSLDASLIVTSLKTQARGPTVCCSCRFLKIRIETTPNCNLCTISYNACSTYLMSHLFVLAPYKLANWTVRAPRSFDSAVKYPRWPHNKQNRNSGQFHGKQRFDRDKAEKGRNTLVKNKF